MSEPSTRRNTVHPVTSRRRLVRRCISAAVVGGAGAAAVGIGARSAFAQTVDESVVVVAQNVDGLRRAGGGPGGDVALLEGFFDSDDGGGGLFT